MSRRLWAGGVALAVVLAAGGVWLAPRSPVASRAALAQPAQARPAEARTPLYYRNPADAADFSPTPKRDAQGRDYLPVYEEETPAPVAADAERTPLYYQDPSGRPAYSAVPKKTADGRDFMAVYEDPSAPPAAATTAAPMPAPGGGPGRLLYYRNPMGLPDTSPVPKKDSMGMDYIAVYEEEANQPAGTVTVSPQRVQMLGVRTEAAVERALTRSVRAVGTIAVDERRLVVVAPRFEGWIQRLLVNETGQPVRRGQPLFEVYSPELAAAEQEYVIAREAGRAMADADRAVRSSTAGIADAALARLRNFDLPEGELTRLRRSGTVSRTLTLSAPIDGVVLEKNAVQGMRFAPGDTLYRLADLSTVWLLAEVFEQDLGLIRPGQEATIGLTAYPERSFEGKVTFLYPTVNATTRTARVRIEIPNPDQLLKPDMYATVEIAAAVGTALMVVVPDSSVLDTGTRQTVLVERAAGRYEPRTVSVGRRAEGYVEIRRGVAAGEKVVVGANFLIDAESNLRAALQAFAPPPAAPGQEAPR